MDELFSQAPGIARIACDNVSRTVNFVNTGYERGTLARAFDACPGTVILIGVCIALATLLATLLVCVYVADRRMARKLATVDSVGSVTTTIVDFASLNSLPATRNLKGTR